jgi:hypothetical protein
MLKQMGFPEYKEKNLTREARSGLCTTFRVLYKAVVKVTQVPRALRHLVSPRVSTRHNSGLSSSFFALSRSYPNFHSPVRQGAKPLDLYLPLAGSLFLVPRTASYALKASSRTAGESTWASKLDKYQGILNCLTCSIRLNNC